MNGGTRKGRKFGLPGWILTGALLGVAAGVVFGERCALFEPVASAYVMLLQSVVYPYIMCTLLHGLGQLTPARAWRLFRSGWHFMVLVWLLTFGVLILLGRIVPPAPAPVLFDATVHSQISSGLLELLIPANLSVDLAQNYVPAVVVFCILFGIALQRFPEREGLLNILSIVRGASLAIWRWLVWLAPFAVFAMFARTAGTIDVTELKDLIFYLLLYLGGAFLLAFAILPLLVSALVPANYREVLNSLKDAFILAAVTTISAVALPYVLEAVQKLAARCEIDKEDSDEIIQTTLSISYPLAQLGNFFVYVFIVFSAFYYRIPMNAAREITLPLMTLFSCIGCPTSSVNAVGFLGSWLQFPAMLSEFYIETMIVTRYGQVIVSVMGFAFVTMLVTLSYYGKLQINKKRLFRAVALSAVLTGVFVAILLLGRTNHPLGRRYSFFTLSPAIRQGVTVSMSATKDASSAPDDSLATFERIQKTQTLRVGYNPHVIPFCYHNASGELVGYDVTYAYALARALNARLEFVAFEWSELVDDLKARRFDIAMSGVYVTEERLREVDVSSAYYQSPLALIVPSREVADYLSMEKIQRNPRFKLTLFRDPILVPMARRLFPDADIKLCHNYEELSAMTETNAALWTLEQARVFAQEHPGFTAVKPDGLSGVQVFGYLMPPDSPEFLRFVNHWLDLKQADGFQNAQRSYWIEGKDREEKPVRWCLLQRRRSDG